jgi:hypothetical protein
MAHGAWRAQRRAAVTVLSSRWVGGDAGSVSVAVQLPHGYVTFFPHGVAKTAGRAICEVVVTGVNAVVGPAILLESTVVLWGLTSGVSRPLTATAATPASGSSFRHRPATEIVNMGFS